MIPFQSLRKVIEITRKFCSGISEILPEKCMLYCLRWKPTVVNARCVHALKTFTYLVKMKLGRAWPPQASPSEPERLPYFGPSFPFACAAARFRARGSPPPAASGGSSALRAPTPAPRAPAEPPRLSATRIGPVGPRLGMRVKIGP